MKPILFNTPMVQALLEDRKTVTRRLVKPHRKAIIENVWFDKSDGKVVVVYNDNYHIGEKGYIKKPYQVGDILYVKETWTTEYDGIHDDNGYGKYVYKADKKTLDIYDGSSNCWRSSLHMPKEATRIFLRVKEVRVERVKDITNEEAVKEGFSDKDAFDYTFFTIYPEATKDTYLWVIEFEKISKEETN